MSVVEIITLIVAMAALVTSCVSAYQMVRQSRNAVRPAVVVLEKHTNNESPEAHGRSLFLVNMGNAMAMNTVLVGPNHTACIEAAGDAPEKSQQVEERHRTEIAVNRRAVLATNYRESVNDKLELLICYVDVNGTKYHTRFNCGEHRFGRGHPMS